MSELGKGERESLREQGGKLPEMIVLDWLKKEQEKRGIKPAEYGPDSSFPDIEGTILDTIPDEEGKEKFHNEYMSMLREANAALK